MGEGNCMTIKQIEKLITSGEKIDVELSSQK